jgi:hypothetical protein
MALAFRASHVFRSTLATVSALCRSFIATSIVNSSYSFWFGMDHCTGNWCTPDNVAHAIRLFIIPSASTRTTELLSSHEERIVQDCNWMWIHSGKHIMAFERRDWLHTILISERWLYTICRTSQPCLPKWSLAARRSSSIYEYIPTMSILSMETY